MVTWELIRDGSDNIGALYDVELVDTANPFGDYAIARIDDDGGQQFDKFPRGTRVELQVTPTDATTAISKFTGFVVERRGLNQNGADALEIEAYSFDQFLRNNTVSKNLIGLTLSDALESIITNDTPVSFVPGNVDVGDEQEIRRSFRGESVETVLQALAFKSQDEAFGVTDALEFFFRPRETQHIDRGIDDTFFLNYDIPELSNEAVNEVEVFFDDGDDRVLVDDGQDKLDIQNSLGLPEPATQRAEIQRPNITELGDAEDEGRQFLQLRNATLTGTVTTFGLFKIEPGDTIDIQITSRGIDAEFTIAAVEFQWGRDETILTIVEKKGNDNSEVIVRLTESTKRVEMAGADRDADKNRIVSTQTTAKITPTVTVNGVTADAAKITNGLRNAVRDGWAGGALPSIDTIRVGGDSAGLSRSNTALRDEIASAAATQSLPTSTSALYEATFNAVDVQEVGLFDASDNLLVRGIFDSDIDPVSIDVRLDVSDDSGERSVITDFGQTVVRDIIADNSPEANNGYRFGSGDTTPTETDTALDSTIDETNIGERLVRDVSTSAEFKELTGGIADDVPLTITDDRLQLEQVCFTKDSDDFQTDPNTSVFAQDSDFSGGEAFGVKSTSDEITITFEVSHRIPADDFSLPMRIRTLNSGDKLGQGLEITFNGVTWQPVKGKTDFGFLDYRDLSNGFGSGTDDYPGGDVKPGTFDLTVSATRAGGDQQTIDVIAPRDGRFDVTLDNQVNSPDGFLDGPELFPAKLSQTLSSVSVASGDTLSIAAGETRRAREFLNAGTVSNTGSAVADDSGIEGFPLPTVETRRGVTVGFVNSTFNDTSNNQFIELANDGQTFTRVSNDEDALVDFATAERGVDVTLGIGRFGTRSGETPLTGFRGQAVNEYLLTIGTDGVVADDIGVALTRVVFNQPARFNDLTGSTVRESGVGDAFTQGPLLTRHVFAEFDVEPNETVIANEETRFE